MMQSKWKLYHLSQVCERVSVGHVGPTSSFFCGSEEGVPFLRSQNVRPGRLNLTDIKYITKEFHNKHKKSQLCPGDLLIVRVGRNRGDCCIVPEDVGELNCANIVFARPKNKLSGFLEYYFRSSIGQESLHSISTGSVQGVLNTKSIAALEIPIPPQNEAISIYNILVKFDQKIDVIKNLNKTLHEICITIFKHWFIDFNFPDKNGKPYRSSGGDMYKVEGCKNDIPYGWKIKKLKEFVDVIKGCSYSSNDLQESSIALVTLKSINRGGGFNQNGYKEYVGEYKEEQQVKDGDIVVAQTDLTQKADVIGRPAIINSLGKYDKLIASLDLQIVSPKNSFFKNFLYYLLQTDDFHNHALSYTNGTTVLHLNKNAIPEYMFISPPKNILSKFENITETLLTKIRKGEEIVQTMYHLRDSLIPKLISGKIRIPIESRK